MLYNAYTCVPVVRPHVHIYYAIHTYIHNMCYIVVYLYTVVDMRSTGTDTHIHLRWVDIMSGDTYQHVM